MNFIDDVMDEEEYEHMNKNIINANMMNMSLIITKSNYGAIDNDDSAYNGYYMIRFYPYPYNPKS